MIIPTVGNTLATTDYEIFIYIGQYLRKLKIHGVSDAKLLTLMMIVKELLEDDNVLDEDKLDLNLVLINLKKTLEIF